MACDLYCPECGENLGKDKEAPALIDCGTCGEEDIYNPAGDTDDMDEDELKRFKAIKEKKNTSRILREHIRNKRGRRF